MSIFIPDTVKRIIGNLPYDLDTVGLSQSQVLMFSDMVLKIERYSKNADETVQMMKWLDGKIPVPKVLCHEVCGEYQYLLMSRIEGKMSCDEYYLEHPHELLALLAEALEMLWSVDIADCPRRRDLDTELEEARYRVENGLVDVEHTEPETFGENGFASPRELLEWLESNKPEVEPALSHGDFCLPNIFLNNGGINGFIDLGDTGIADKWRDISLCYRSLKHNFDGSFGGKVYSDFD
ncbi:MAG: aminoglycoside 3'-phosphotransferase, partial [Oscillospiraceae bacterium]|nr:aminoglycoside 3'-phosphotransferase [Oscillospiraceae bacterium]